MKSFLDPPLAWRSVLNAQSEPRRSKGDLAAASDSEKAPLAKIRKEEERGFLHPLFSPLLLHPNGRFYPPLLLSLRRITLTLAAEEEERLNKKILSALQRKLRNRCGTVATKSAIRYMCTHKRRRCKES